MMLLFKHLYPKALGLCVNVLHVYVFVCVCFSSGKSVMLVRHTVTLQDLKESHRVYCVVAGQHGTMLEKGHR